MLPPRSAATLASLGTSAPPRGQGFQFPNREIEIGAPAGSLAERRALVDPVPVEFPRGLGGGRSDERQPGAGVFDDPSPPPPAGLGGGRDSPSQRSARRSLGAVKANAPERSALGQLVGADFGEGPTAMLEKLMDTLERMEAEIGRLSAQNEEMQAKQVKILQPVLTKFFNAGGKNALKRTFSSWKNLIIGMQKEKVMYAELSVKQKEGENLFARVRAIEKELSHVADENKVKEKKAKEVREEHDHFVEQMQKYRKEASQMQNAVQETKGFIHKLRGEVHTFGAEFFPEDEAFAGEIDDIPLSKIQADDDLYTINTRLEDIMRTRGHTPGSKDPRIGPQGGQQGPSAPASPLSVQEAAPYAPAPASAYAPVPAPAAAGYAAYGEVPSPASVRMPPAPSAFGEDGVASLAQAQASMYAYGRAAPDPGWQPVQTPGYQQYAQAPQDAWRAAAVPLGAAGPPPVAPRAA